MTTTILVIIIAVLLIIVIKLTGAVFALTGWLFKFLIIVGLILFVLWKLPRRR